MNCSHKFFSDSVIHRYIEDPTLLLLDNAREARKEQLRRVSLSNQNASNFATALNKQITTIREEASSLGEALSSGSLKRSHPHESDRTDVNPPRKRTDIERPQSPLARRSATSTDELADLIKKCTVSLGDKIDSVKSDLTSQIDSVDSRLTGRVDKVDARLTDEIRRLEQKLAQQANNIEKFKEDTNTTILNLPEKLTPIEAQAPTESTIRRAALNFALERRSYLNATRERKVRGVFIIRIKDRSLLTPAGPPDLFKIKQLIGVNFRVLKTDIDTNGEMKIKAKLDENGDRVAKIHNMLRNRRERYSGKIGLGLSVENGPNYEQFWFDWKRAGKIEGFGLSTGGNDQLKLKDGTFVTFHAPENVLMLDIDKVNDENLKKLNGQAQEYFVFNGDIEPLPEEFKLRPTNRQTGAAPINPNPRPDTAPMNPSKEGLPAHEPPTVDLTVQNNSPLRRKSPTSTPVMDRARTSYQGNRPDYAHTNTTRYDPYRHSKDNHGAPSNNPQVIGMPYGWGGVTNQPPNSGQFSGANAQSNMFYQNFQGMPLNLMYSNQNNSHRRFDSGQGSERDW